MSSNSENILLVKFKANSSNDLQLQDSIWHFPPAKLQLAENEVHIWGKYLDTDNFSNKEVWQDLRGILAPNEQKRADRFRLEIHRQRFTVARATLRNILANYLNLDAKQIQFKYSDRGKPSLIDNSIEFNLSHSQDLAIYGFTKNRKIGVDLEYLRNMPDAESLAKRFFSNNEYTAIASLETAQKQPAFFQIWTAKEAYLKATGVGLSASLDSIEIAVNSSSNSVKIASIDGNDRAGDNWYLSSFKIDDLYLAALAVELNKFT